MFGERIGRWFNGSGRFEILVRERMRVCWKVVLKKKVGKQNITSNCGERSKSNWDNTRCDESTFERLR